MRVELEKGSRYVVFTLGDDFRVPADDVRIYTYKGMCRVSEETYSIRFARKYWKMLVTRGYRVVSSKVPETLA